MGDLDALDKVYGASGLHGVQLGQHFPRVGGQGDENAELREGHQPHRRLRVGPQLGLDRERDTWISKLQHVNLENSLGIEINFYLSDEVNGILLGLQPSGQEVTVSHVLGVVHAEILTLRSWLNARF